MSKDKSKKLASIVVLLEGLLVREEQGWNGIMLDHEGGRGSKDKDIVAALKLGLVERKKFSPPKKFASAFHKHWRDSGDPYYKIDGWRTIMGHAPRRRLYLTDAGRQFYDAAPPKMKGRSPAIVSARLYGRKSKYDV